MKWDGEKKVFSPIDKDLFEGASEPAGGLYSNIDDMAKFVAFEMSAWPPRTAPERPPLSRSSTRESQLSAGPDVPGGVGVNWFVFKKTFGLQADHAGALDGYRSQVELLPRRGIAILVLSGALSKEDWDGIVSLLITNFAPLGSEAPPTTGPTAQAAVERLVEWLNHPDRESAKTVFTQEFIDALPHFEKDAIKALKDNGGGCRLDHFTEPGVNHVGAKLACKDAPWTFQIQIQPVPPHLIEGWWWE
jgi:hypothetical protein